MISPIKEVREALGEEIGSKMQKLFTRFEKEQLLIDTLQTVEESDHS